MHVNDPGQDMNCFVRQGGHQLYEMPDATSQPEERSRAADLYLNCGLTVLPRSRVLRVHGRHCRCMPQRYRRTWRC